MNRSIGILYICTGPYKLFWKDFYESFEKYFLPETEKRYFVFTDSRKEEIYGFENESKIKIVHIENMPWPLVTLFRFDTFLKIEEELKKCDYLLFSNANMICNKKISEKEFLPTDDKKLLMTVHPGYYKKSKIEYPYDRNNKCLAYIPWNCGKYYVIGAMLGGTSDAFLEMSHKLRDNINEDLKKNVIAKWHDESHINRYILNRNDVKFLSPEYCYPYGMNVSYERKISAVSKQEKFDVKTFKGQYENKENVLNKCVRKLKNKLMIKEHILCVVDTILKKKVK